MTDVAPLRRFDVAQFQGISMVIVESEILPPDPVVVVIPLLTDYPAVRHLNPQIRLDGRTFILATRLIAAVHRNRLRRTGSVADQADQVIRAVDILLTGV